MKLQSHNHLKLTTLLLNYAEHFQTKQLLQIQAQLITNPPLSLHPNLIAVKLIGACAANANLYHAQLIFAQLPNPNVFSWNAIIKAHINCGAWEHALNCFNRQLSLPSAPNPNEYIYTSLIKACAGLEAIADGLKVHAVVIKSGFDNNIHLGTSLVDMYFKFREPASAGQVFDEMPLRDVVSWNTMVSGYCLCGDLESARRVFDQMLERDVVSWNAMIGGYVQNGKYSDAIEVFHEMQKVGGVVPDDVTLVSVLSACAHVGALDFGRWIDRFVGWRGRGLNLYLGNALIDMYAKCGTMEEARRIFDGMRERDVISWSTMICGSGTHGDADEAFGYYSKMLECGVKPNEVTFMGLLSACSHAGLVDKGIELFSRMIQEYRIVPKVGHYGCVIDLLSRAGRLDEAEDLINSMPIEPNVIVWGALLGGCRIHKDFRRGERVAQHLLELDSEYTGSYVYIAGAKASVGRVDDAANCWLRMQHKGIIKDPGCSKIEVHNTVHEFKECDNTSSGKDIRLF